MAAATHIIGRATRVAGSLSGSGDVEVRGYVEGSVALDGTVTVADGAVVRGDISARHVHVEGAVVGDMRADRVTLGATARVVGDMTVGGLSVAPGAQLRGAVEMDTTATTRPAAPAPPRPPATPAPAPAVPAPPRTPVAPSDQGQLAVDEQPASAEPDAAATDAPHDEGPTEAAADDDATDASDDAGADDAEETEGGESSPSSSNRRGRRARRS